MLFHLAPQILLLLELLELLEILLTDLPNNSDGETVPLPFLQAHLPNNSDGETHPFQLIQQLLPQELPYQFPKIYGVQNGK
jgi:hypothetical protein